MGVGFADEIGEAEAAIACAREDATVGRRVAPLDAFTSKPAARVAATIILAQQERVPGDDAVAVRRTRDCKGVELVRLLEALRTAGIGDPLPAIDSLVDASLLYRRTLDGGAVYIEFARPCDADTYASAEAPSVRALLLLTAVQLMVHGIISVDDAHAVTHVNAGSALEELVRPYVGTLIPTRPKFEGGRIRIRSGALEARWPDNTEWTSVSEEVLRRLDGQLLVWSNETGLDGVVLSSIASKGAAPRRWALHGWQRKGGHRAQQVRGGKLTTSEDSVKEDGNVSRVDDSCWHGIVVKAQVGMCVLACAFHRSVKAADEATAAAGGVTDQPWAAALRRHAVTVNIHHGVGWLKACLPLRLSAIATWMDAVPAPQPPSAVCTML